MIFKKFWGAMKAQLNKLANVFWEADPIAQMRYEYDRAVEELKSGREGLEQYRGLVENITRSMNEAEKQHAKLVAQAKAYLRAGDRETAGKFALEAQKLKARMEDQQKQLEMHELSYENNLKKIQHASKKLHEVRDKIQQYDAELKMSEAEAEVAKLAESFQFNVTTDFGQLEDVVQRRIDANRGKARVASDLSREGLADIHAEEQMESILAEDALKELEIETGVRTPETATLPASQRQLGPEVRQVVTSDAE